MKEHLSQLADLWFSPKQFEKEGTVYERLCVRKVKRYIPTGDLFLWKALKKVTGGAAVDRSDESLHTAHFGTKVIETVHLGGTVFFLEKAAVALHEGQPERALLATGFNIALNAYPIMIQRYNRARIENVFEQRARDK